MKTKIIISSYDDLKNPVYSGGGAYAVHQLAKRLSKKYSVTVVTGSFKKAKNQMIDNVSYVRIGSCVFGHKIGQLIYQFALLKYSRNQKYDLWIESTTPPFTFSLLSKYSKKPVIAWVNMLCGEDMQRKYKLNFRVIEQELCKLYKHIITPTDWVKKEVLKMNKDSEVSTITLGLEKKTAIKNVINNFMLKNYLLFLGRIEVDQKGLDLLIKALFLTRDEIQLVIA